MEQPDILTKEEFYNKIGVLQPIYPLTKGITNKIIQKSVSQIVKEISLDGDFLSPQFRRNYKLCTHRQAIIGIHFPKDKEQVNVAIKRLVFEEFFLFAIGLRKMRNTKISQKNNFIITDENKLNSFFSELPYKLTKAQQKTWIEVKANLKSGLVMNRLIQGDVGSGKTIIAIMALLLVASNGYQGALMVPTEVLAKQHYEEFKRVLTSYNINIVLLVGSMTAKEKKEVYNQIREKKAHIVIGTHALIQEQVEYSELALVITDEQHRFGVRQRENLLKKGGNPHVLVMSATPIPRTLALMLYGDLDISIIDELPAERLPIRNCLVNTNYRKTAYSFMEQQGIAGHQSYVVCPMVDESETIEAENVIEYTEKIRESISSDLTVEYLHGKMKAKEKNRIMERFVNGEINILVSTTVIEVGVNVPNATVMMIENAERFGLATLHQLRGRVGRGKYQSYCILVDGSDSKESRERLSILDNSNDGFYIANEDLKIRGQGDLFGTLQSGDMDFKVADVFRDAELLKLATKAANEITKSQMEQICKKNYKFGENIVL